jgi:Flp pilus assembly pilin Flp
MSTPKARISLNCTCIGAWNGFLGAQVRRLLFETDGQDMIEYALLTTFIGFAGAAAWNAMQTGLGNAYTGFNNAVWNLWSPPDPVGGGS